MIIMKKTLAFVMGLSLLALYACNKLEQPNAPEFSVSTDKTVINLGDTVVFNFSGVTDYLTFYSGEVGADYNFKQGRVKHTEYFITFRTERRSGDQLGQFSLHASTNFNGTFDYASVNNATWIDITSRFTLAPKNDFSAYETVNITDLVVPGKPLYLGWRYLAKNATANGLLNTWRFRDFVMTKVADDGATSQIASQTTPNWKMVGSIAVNTALYNISSTRVTFNQTPSQVVTGNEETYWAINGNMFSLTTSEDYGPDRPVSLKSYASNGLSSINHVYQQPGDYEAVFVGINGNVKDRHEVVRKIKIKVQ